MSLEERVKNIIIEKLGVSVAVTNTLMKSDHDRRALAAFTIDAGTLRLFRS